VDRAAVMVEVRLVVVAQLAYCAEVVGRVPKACQLGVMVKARLAAVARLVCHEMMVG